MEPAAKRASVRSASGLTVASVVHEKTAVLATSWIEVCAISVCYEIDAVTDAVSSVKMDLRVQQQRLPATSLPSLQDIHAAIAAHLACYKEKYNGIAVQTLNVFNLSDFVFYVSTE